MIYTKYLILITLILMLLINQNKITSSHYECMNNNNCYSYAFNNIHKKYKDKPQPGSYSNIKQVERNNKEYKCKNFIHRVLSDYPQSRFLSVDDYKSGSRCKDNEYTIFLALDNEGISTDYHFYKENEDGYWSHKPGLNNITYIDDSGHAIKNPLYADRDYENSDINNENKYNYKVSCGFFCNKKIE